MSEQDCQHHSYCAWIPSFVPSGAPWPKVGGQCIKKSKKPTLTESDDQAGPSVGATSDTALGSAVERLTEGFSVQGLATAQDNEDLSSGDQNCKNCAFWWWDKNMCCCPDGKTPVCNNFDGQCAYCR